MIADGTDLSCFEQNDGTLSATVTGGLEPYTYLWTPGDYTTATVEDVPAGDYEVMVLDADGCPAIGSVSLSQPDPFSIQLTGMNETVEGEMDGFIETAVTGGIGVITYSWENTQIAFLANTANIDQLAPGEYCLVATDENNCTAEACFTIGEGEDICLGFTNDSATVNLDSEISCFGANDGTATVIVDGGQQPYTFLWSNDETGQTANSLPPGTASVTITDANNCISEQTVEVPEPQELAIDVAIAPESTVGFADGSLTIQASNAVEPFSCAWTGDNLSLIHI